jgi:tRNA pseudouridine38-40 synthase
VVREARTLDSPALRGSRSLQHVDMDENLTLPYFRAVISYDGTDFLGFQWQTAGRTVQGVLESAVAQVTQAATRVVGSGRTDAGVHARGQVIAFRVSWRHTVADLQRALNAVLPMDIAVRELSLAQPGWHPRFSARSRHYRYIILNQLLRSPLDRRYAHHVIPPLDLAALQAASACLIGEHDFASFGRPTQGDSTVRAVISAEWWSSGPWFIFDIVGNAFLRGMVRSLTGSLLQAGTGAWPTEMMQTVLLSRDRAAVAPPAPACGLCLMAVAYEEEPLNVERPDVPTFNVEQE